MNQVILSHFKKSKNLYNYCSFPKSWKFDYFNIQKDSLFVGHDKMVYVSDSQKHLKVDFVRSYSTGILIDDKEEGLWIIKIYPLIPINVIIKKVKQYFHQGKAEGFYYSSMTHPQVQELGNYHNNLKHGTFIITTPKSIKKEVLSKV